MLFNNFGHIKRETGDSLPDMLVYKHVAELEQPAGCRCRAEEKRDWGT